MRVKPRVLILSGVWPFVQGNREAANVICHEITRGLAETQEFTIQYAALGLLDQGISRDGEADIAQLKLAGVDFLPFVQLRPQVVRGWRQRLLALAAWPPALLMGAGQQAAILKACGGVMPDAVLTIWSEAATAAAMQLPVPKLTYYGNPDHKVMQALTDFEWEHRRRWWDLQGLGRWLIFRFYASLVKRAHLRVMRRYQWIGDVAHNDALFYRTHGLSQAHYIQNMWPACSAVPATASTSTTTDSQRVIKIAGNVGNLSATGNTHGLWMLAKTILPQLKKQFVGREFKIHLFGAGRPHPLVAAILEHCPELVVRGFVPDIDAELLDSAVFLIPNNHRKFIVGHTRFLHAWSLGLCVVAFTDSAKAMPEIRHRHNALLAETPAEFAALVHEACDNSELRTTIGGNGRETLRREFSSTKVVAELQKRLHAAISPDQHRG